MPERPDGDFQTGVGDDLQALFREHQRLRGDVERLLQQKQDLLHETQTNGGRKKGNEAEQEEEGEQEGEQKDEDKEPAKPPFRKRAWNWAHTHPLGVLLIVIALIAAIVGTILLLRYLGSYVSTDDAQIDGHLNLVSSRVSGTVSGVYVEDNRSVVKGQTLVDLDPRDYITAVAQAEANLAQALAQISAQSPNVPITETTQSTNVRTTQLDVRNAEAALGEAQHNYQSAVADQRQAEANALNSATEEVRYRNLAEKEEVSREQYDQRATRARADAQLVESRRAASDASAKIVDQRLAALAQARERFTEAQANQPRQVAVQHATVETRRANAKAAQAQLDQARLNLSYCKIGAPVAGIVGNKTVELGQRVSPGQEMMAITRTDDIWITANFKETQTTQMRPGQSVTVHVDAVDLDFHGWVQNMPGATGARFSLLPPENATGNFVKVVQRLPVRIRLNPGQPGMERLRPGMSVEPKVWLR
jgi:membrane fusion protein, multidrug efflux system